jgi:hypothetical protein
LILTIGKGVEIFKENIKKLLAAKVKQKIAQEMSMIV